jgi:hypothetical protein
MSQNKYVLVATDGTSHDLSNRELFTAQSFDLADLLEDGWRPVHETPLGQSPAWNEDGSEGGTFAWALILLVKD